MYFPQEEARNGQLVEQQKLWKKKATESEEEDSDSEASSGK